MRRPIKKTPVTPRRAKSASTKPKGRIAMKLGLKKEPTAEMVKLKIGDKVQVAGGVHTVEHDANGIFVRCTFGRHYLRDRGYRYIDSNASTPCGVAVGEPIPDRPVPRYA